MVVVTLSAIGLRARVPSLDVVTETTDSPRTPSRDRSAAALHIFALSGFAVAQPVFDLLGRNATFFAAHDATTASIVLLVLFLLVVPAGVILLTVAAASAVSEDLGRRTHIAAVSGLAGLIAAPPIARAAGLDTGLTLLVFGGTAVLAGLAYVRFKTLRDILSLAAVAPLLFAGFFLFATPVRGLMTGDQSPDYSADHALQTPVVVLIFDEFGVSGLLTASGEINRQRFPNFGRLADVATWYPNATTVHDHTPVAVTSILTGVLPANSAVPTDDSFPGNLFTLLGEEYTFRVDEPVTRLCPPDLCAPGEPAGQRLNSLLNDTVIAYLHTTLPDGARNRWLPSIDDRWAGFTEPTESERLADDPPSLTRSEVLEETREVLRSRAEHVRLQDFLGELAESSSPDTLYFLHSLLPHAPWRYLPTGQIYPNDAYGDLFTEESGAYWREDPLFTNLGIQRYLLQLGYVDGFIGAVLDQLEESGLLDSSLLVVMADHGISFRPGLSRRNLRDGGSAGEILAIPLFIKVPGQTSGEVARLAAQTTDVLPTMADALGVEVGWDVAGRSLLDAAADREQGSVVSADGVHPLPEGVLTDAIAFAQEYAEVFGSGNEPHDVYAMGPFRHLVGGPIPGGVGRGENLPTASLARPEALQSVDPEAELVPARITGVFRGEPQTRDIALGLGDRIASVGRAYEDREGQWRFSVFVDPSLLRDGCNPTSLYAIESDSVLAEIELTNPVECS